MEIKSNTENKLLKRKEIEALVADKEASMSRHDIKAQIAKAVKAKPELVVVENIDNHFGSKDVLVKAFVYDDETTLKRLTSEHMIKRNTAPAVEAAEGEEA